MPQRSIIPIEAIDDERIAPYRSLKDRDLAREGGRFIAEGELVVQRLLTSGYKVESLLLAMRRVEEIAPLAPAGVPIYAAPAEVVNRIVGFKFHSGVMACGVRGRKRTLEELAAGWRDERITLMVLPEIEKTDNMGSLIRIGSAFGAAAVILGERSCDPFYRQSIRVSMGTLFSMPLVQSENLRADLQQLRQRWGVELVAAVAEPDAEPLAQARRGRRLGILFGNEAQGLRPDEIAVCDRKVTIPMHLGTDSLNVSIAAGVMLYHFTQYAGQ